MILEMREHSKKIGFDLTGIRRRKYEDDDRYENRVRTLFYYRYQDKYANRLSEIEELTAYRNLLSFMELHINYTQSNEELTKAIMLISSWGRVWRAGNGEIPEIELERRYYNIIREMGNIKSGK